MDTEAATSPDASLDDYEARGILPAPARTSAGYRLYPPETVDLLLFVVRARRLGLTLSEIAHIVGLTRAGSPPCAHVRELLEQKAADLARLRRELRRTLNTWRAADGLTAVICPHIEAKGGDIIPWRKSRSRFVPIASTARKSSSTATRSGSAKTATRRS